MQWLQRKVEQGQELGLGLGLGGSASLLSLEPSLIDGTLLCRLVTTLHRGREGDATDDNACLGHSFTWNSNPHTHAQRVRNVEKALHHLSLLPGMGRRCLDTCYAERICAGDWAVLTGLLEDMHRFNTFSIVLILLFC